MAQIAENDLRNLAFPYISPRMCQYQASTIACREARRVNVEAQSGNFTEGKVYCLFSFKVKCVCARTIRQSFAGFGNSQSVHIYFVALTVSLRPKPFF